MLVAKPSLSLLQALECGPFEEERGGKGTPKILAAEVQNLGKVFL